MKKTLRKYQKLLGLEDWKITVTEVPILRKEENSGEVDWDREYKSAKIRLLRQKDRDEKNKNWIERDLVHELIHLVLDRAKWDLAEDEERAVIKLSYAIVPMPK